MYLHSHLMHKKRMHSASGLDQSSAGALTLQRRRLRFMVFVLFLRIASMQHHKFTCPDVPFALFESFDRKS